MGGELFNCKLSTPSRTFYFDLKQGDQGVYLSISEVGHRGDGKEPRSRIVIDEQDIPDFAAAIAAIREFQQPVTPPAEKPAKALKRPPNAGKAWDPVEAESLASAFKSGTTIVQLATTHGRTRGAITAKLEKLGLVTRS